MRNPARRFKKVEKLIAKIVGRFCRRYDLPWDEAWSAGCLGFCQAAHSFDPERCPFPKWCAWKVQKALTGLVCERAEERLRGRQVYGLDLTRFKTKSFDVGPLLWRLDADGVEAVMMVLDPPGPVKYRTRVGGGTGGAMRRAVKKQLLEMGWNKRRIDKTFRRVRNQL
jgi:hypothetical protein